MMDAYSTVAQPASAEIDRVKGSRFLGDAFPCESGEEALRLVDSVRQREPKATHHCWAYRIDPHGDEFRVSDDGEPTGTAGLPILRQIEGQTLACTLVVVTRYYGGTKLGAGGLIRAYGDAAAEVLRITPRVERLDRVLIDLTFDYSDTAAAMQTLHHFKAEISRQDYGQVVLLSVLVPRSRAAALQTAFRDALGGRGAAEPID